ncbi:hypothetical protein GOP47_0009421 [Adiantum capillus-veneris]|uniref:Uncharacterized protein n=1 Tax=Adiantum capillus-veneris TaxID=13818 RepID=A0A9D4UW62_ADICA|nr:hypothetical protein GOP47_0009421 [Adiantum capillus-veneris]
MRLEAPIMVKPPEPSPSTAVLELSNLDHMLNFYCSVILFYSSEPHTQLHATRHGNNKVIPFNDTHYIHPRVHTTDVGLVVKCALQELLAHYPAAAGRLHLNTSQNRLEVECNDHGVQFVSGHANILLSDLGDVTLAHPNIDLLFPTIVSHEEERPPIVALQVTMFNCGGFALALTNNHAYLDGHSAAIFLHNLASIARGDGISISPDTISRRERMKPQSPPIPTFHHPLIMKKKDDATYVDMTLLPTERYGTVTRISFCANALKRLRSDVLIGHTYFKDCSRYQALIALLWKARARSLLQTQEIPNCIELPIRIPVNIRGRMMPTLTHGYVGNGILCTIVSASLQELCELPLYLIVLKIQRALFAFTPEFVQSMLDHLECGEVPLEFCPDPSFFGMSSLVNLPFYDTNFGWGSPIYCGLPSRQMNNRLYILDGGGQAHQGWNAMVVLESNMERQIFFETLADYVTFST